jgi:hypothetical protein
MVHVIVTTPLDNIVEATTSVLLTFSFKKRPWSNNQQAPFNSHLKPKFLQGNTSSKPFFTIGEKIQIHL